MELRKKMGLPGKHPGCQKCPNLGTANCHCKSHEEAAAVSDDALVAEITKRVIAALGK